MLKRLLKIENNRIVDHRPVNHPDVDETWVEAQYDKEACDGLTLNEIIFHGCGKVVKGKVKVLKARKEVPKFNRISNTEVLLRALKNKANLTDDDLIAARFQLEAELSQ